MSEIKGQLLGMLLVLAVFALVGGTLYAHFQKTNTAIENKMNEETVLISGFDA